MAEIPGELAELRGSIDNIDAALNWSITLPTEGPEALQDRTEGLPVFETA